jgi:hypothetical protein
MVCGLRVYLWMSRREHTLSDRRTGWPNLRLKTIAKADGNKFSTIQGMDGLAVWR